MLFILVVNIVVVTTAVVLHYEFLSRLSRILPRLNIPHRSKTLLAVLGGLTAHCAEIWLFGIMYYFLQHQQTFHQISGQLLGKVDGQLLDFIYFSFTTFTTLGFGDITPTGAIRFLAGIEALTGFVLITWTASFIYIEMQKFWDNDK